MLGDAKSIGLSCGSLSEIILELILYEVSFLELHWSSTQVKADCTN